MPAPEDAVRAWPWRAYRQYQDAPRGRSYEWVAASTGQKVTK